MKENHCQVCKGSKNLRVNSKHRLKDGTLRPYYICRDCNTAAKRKYRQTEHGKKMTRHAIYQSASRNKNKTRARALVRYHVINGNIRKPDNCSQCGIVGAEAHHDDYAYALDITWLCRQCHADKHYAKNESIHL